ncbi:MAG TPA: TlpA disulfide reductase family protein [Pirellulaceae bacterium]
MRCVVSGKSALFVGRSSLAIVVTFILGCTAATPPSSPPTTKATSNVTLVRADAAALNELIGTRKGHVVLVDYWATWCGPCVANFPHTVELAKKHKAEGLATIAVSFDLFEDEAKVRDFLAKQGADFDNLISSHNAIGQKPAEDFDVGPLPEYRLYDRQGKLRQKWESGIDQAELDKKVAELLAEST